MKFSLSLLALACFSSNAAYSAIYYASDFASLSNSINLANSNPNSTIYLAPATYSGGALPYILSSVTISLDPAANAAAGSAILRTDPTGQKGLLTVPDSFGGNTVSGVNLTINGLRFDDAIISAGSGGNAAGIRYQGSGAATLSVSNSIFYHNQNGILAASPAAIVDQMLTTVISNSLFANNGAPDGSEHALYIFGKSLEVTSSTFCGTVGGHDIKSRTAVTKVTNSTLYDGAADLQDALCTTGSSSYALDASNGGQVTVSGTTFRQGAGSPNNTILSYGAEGVLFSTNSLVIENSAFISDIPGTGIRIPPNASQCVAPVQLTNTTFSANLTPVIPSTCVTVSSGPTNPTPTPVDEPPTLWMMLAALAAGATLWAKSRGTGLAFARLPGRAV